MMWLYEGHMVGLFLDDEPLQFDECYCETCGDSDTEIGQVEIAEDVLSLLAVDISVIPEFCGLYLDYIMDPF